MSAIIRRDQWAVYLNHRGEKVKGELQPLSRFGNFYAVDSTHVPFHSGSSGCLYPLEGKEEGSRSLYFLPEVSRAIRLIIIRAVRRAFVQLQVEIFGRIAYSFSRAVSFRQITRSKWVNIARPFCALCYQSTNRSRVHVACVARWRVSVLHGPPGVSVAPNGTREKLGPHRIPSNRFYTRATTEQIARFPHCIYRCNEKPTLFLDHRCISVFTVGHTHFQFSGVSSCYFNTKTIYMLFIAS